MMPSISLVILLALISTLHLTEGDGDGGHHHIIIHVPYHVKKIKHTHTITKHIHHGGGDKYEVLGYTVGRPINIGGHEDHGDLGGHLDHGGHVGQVGQGAQGGHEIQEAHFENYGNPSFEQVGNELNQEGFNLGGHQDGFASFGGGGGGGHEEYAPGY